MAQTTSVYTDEGLRALVDQMTLDEKITMLSAKNVWETAVSSDVQVVE